jgi:hypothetical protein
MIGNIANMNRAQYAAKKASTQSTCFFNTISKFPWRVVLS